ncbi:MAG: AAA family ATPase [Steroidobacterales bacterium]
MAFELRELLAPASFPHEVNCLQTRETALSWIVLTGPFAYKIKKSLHLDYVNTTTLASRRHLCAEELRLNRRLAPDLYVDVVAIVREAGGLRIASSGNAVEYAVRMRQFDPAQELACLLERHEVSPGEIAAFAEDIADFHAGAAIETNSADYPGTERLYSAVRSNLGSLLARQSGGPGPNGLGRLVDWTHDCLSTELRRIRAREYLGFIRECHGDLHAHNVVRWKGRLTAFDCIEFAPGLRWIDTMNDVAFMVMDLAGHDRWDLAMCFLNRYLERSGDYAGVRLLAFYAAYRALVRAMVDSIFAQQHPEQIGEYLQRAQRRIATAAGFMDRPRPALILMHGPSGSGKSWVSERLCGPLHAVRVRSDVERKRFAADAGAGNGDGGVDRGLYAPQVSEHTYARLADCAEDCLGGGFNTIIDAAFLRHEDRQRFTDLAARREIPCLILSCAADRSVLAERIEARRRAASDPSDANLAVLQKQLRSAEALDALELENSIAVDTNDAQTLPHVLAAVRDRCGAHLAGATDIH